MGVWGVGLYSSDMAADMRATIKSVLRLPLDENRIVDILRDCQGRTATDPGDEDYTTFWLVLADQFEKRGVAHAATREKAIAIIDQGDDLRMMEKRGMKAADLRKRGARLSELRTRLAAAPGLSRTRATIDAPEPFVFELGWLYACPVMGSSCANPYFTKKDLERFPWIPNGWRQFLILNRGRAFDYLAWYQPLVCKKPVQQKPQTADACSDLWWQLHTPKTCSPRVLERLGIISVGNVPIDMDKARARFAKSRPGIVFLGWDGRGAAVNDVSIADTMNASSHDWDTWYEPRGLVPAEGPAIMSSLEQIVSEPDD